MAKNFTASELATFDGKDGRATYVAYKGKVYDVSRSSLWGFGEHLDGHPAGKDLSDDLSDAPHGDEVFSDFPVVGELS